MATGLYPHNADIQRIYAAKLLYGVDGFVVIDIPTLGQCCGIKSTDQALLSIVVYIDDDYFFFTGQTDEIYNILLGLQMVNGRKATSADAITAIRAAVAQPVTIFLSGVEFKCRYIVNSRTVRVFQKKSAIQNLLLNGQNQIIHTGNGSKVFVGA